MISYFTCPYCLPFKGGHGRKVPKTIGKYRVKVINDLLLVFQCQKCSKSFRVKMMGSPLLWSDMSVMEKKAFQKPEWVHKKTGVNKDVKRNKKV